MSEVFHVCASQGGNNCVELDLPASDYEMLDLMERLRLEPGQPPYLEILRYREEFDYLERCIHDQPDICQLNALARKLSAFSGVQDMAVFEGLVGKEIGEKSRTIPIPRLNHTTYLDGEMPQILELAQRLSELDARDGLPRYKAVLAAADCSEIEQALSLAGTVDAYIFDPAVSSPEDVAMGELCVMAGQECAADFAQYVDLPAFGRALLERDHAVITGYGLIERQDGQPILQEEQASGLKEMEM